MSHFNEGEPVVARHRHRARRQRLPPNPIGERVVEVRHPKRRRAPVGRAVDRGDHPVVQVVAVDPGFGTRPLAPLRDIPFGVGDTGSSIRNVLH